MDQEDLSASHWVAIVHPRDQHEALPADVRDRCQIRYMTTHPRGELTVLEHTRAGLGFAAQETFEKFPPLPAR